MAGRAPATVEADSDQVALWRQLDFFPTPPWAARAGGEILGGLDPTAFSIWEPACGAGHMASALAERFDVFASDVHPQGFGQAIDFLDPAAPVRSVDWIVTNPPFRTAGEFVRLGLERARRGVALLLRLQFLEGCERHALFYGARPLTLLCPFAERVPMTLGRWDPAAASATAYAWFFWMHGALRHPPLGIPPGTKRRLTRIDDAARFGAVAPAGLLKAMQGGPGAASPMRS